jgi:tetratricopeptide (TPR) repeat protein
MLAACEPRLAGKPVRLVGVVPADSAEPARAAAAAAGAKLPLLVDPDDAVYAAAGVRTHPAIAVADRARKVVAFEPYHQVDYCEVLVARIRRALGEIGDAEVSRAVAPASSQLPGDSPEAVAHRHVSLGRKLLAAKAYRQAHESARKAIALAPSADAWRLEGEVFAAEGRCPDAVRSFDAALALAPGDAAATAARRACGR